MTTPNGQPASEQPGVEPAAPSTVLALDGWGPIVPTATANGANGHASAPETPPVDEAPIEVAGITQRLPAWQGIDLPVAWLDVMNWSPLVRTLAPAVVMTLSALLVLKLGQSLQNGSLTIPNRAIEVGRWRRQLALWIDPSLTPATTRDSWLQRVRSSWQR